MTKNQNIENDDIKISPTPQPTPPRRQMLRAHFSIFGTRAIMGEKEQTVQEFMLSSISAYLCVIVRTTSRGVLLVIY
jgi:hypothetical protein